MKRLLIVLIIVSFNFGLFGQTKKYYTNIMNFQMYSNGVPSGNPSISAREDTITITTKDISITNYVYGSKKTSTFKITSVVDSIYVCQVDDFQSYKVYIKDKFWIVVERYSGKDLFTIRKYLMKTESVK